MATKLRPVTGTLALATLLAAAPAVQAVGFGDMFNPGRWFGGNNSNDDYYYDAPYGPYGGGPYGGPGYGPYGGPGYGAYGGAPGYGGYGYGGAPYGYGYAPGYAPGVTPGVVPGVAPAYGESATPDAKDEEIEALKRRIEQLEGRQSGQPAAPATSDGWPAAPAFRPMDQY